MSKPTIKRGRPSCVGMGRLLIQWRAADVAYLLASAKRYEAAGDITAGRRERAIAEYVRTKRPPLRLGRAGK